MRSGARQLCCVALLGVACISRGAYECDNDVQCQRPDRVAVCVADVGYCAYLDDTCPSGFRFSDLAGPSALDCVPSATSTATTTSTATEAATGDPSASSTDSDAGTTTGTTPACPNNTLDDGEECDDGNLQDGDGCNADCVLSGEPRWNVHFSGAGGQDDAANAITWLDGAGLVVTGRLDEGNGFQLWVARLDITAGELVWSYLRDAADAPSAGMAIVQAGNGGLFVTGFATPETGQATYFAGFPIDADDNGEVAPLGKEEDGVFLVGRVGNAIAAGGGRLIVAGEAAGRQSFVQVLATSPEGDTHWSATTSFAADANLNGVHMDSISEAFLVGHLGSDLWVARAVDESEEIVTLDTVDGGLGNLDIGQAVVASGRKLFVAGFVSTRSERDRWAGAYTLGSDQLQWSYPGEGAEQQALDDEIEALALDSSGNLIAAGFVRTGSERYLVLLKLSPSGEPIWERTYGDESGREAIPRSLVVGDDDVMYVAGERRGADPTMAAWIAAFSP